MKNSPYAGEFDLVDLSAVSSAQAYAYAEQQLISRRFARQKDQSAFLLSKDGSASVMLCEEDHIRLQVRAAGQDLEGAYAKADKLDDALLERDAARGGVHTDGTYRTRRLLYVVTHCF